MSQLSCEQKTCAKQQSVRGNQSNFGALRRNRLIHQTPVWGTGRLGHVTALRGVRIVAYDLKPLATLKGGGLLGHFTAWVPIWRAQIRSYRSGRDRGGSELMRPPQYRWTRPEEPTVTFWSMVIERALNSLRAVQKLWKQGPAR
jgi:hypothetical protein